HPTSGDCYTCHGTNVNYFSGQALPTNHIPILTGAACSTCHTTAGNFAVYTPNMTTLHTAVSTTCSTCHADGKGPFAGVTGFKIVMMSTKGLHIPITNKGIAVECSGCHVVTTFSGTIMKHAAIGDTPSSAAGNACEAGHEFGYRTRFFGGTINWVRPDPNHEGGKDCVGSGCHANGANGQTTKFKNMKNVVRPPAGTKPGVAGPRAVAGSGSLRAGMDAADRPVRRLGGAVGGSLAAAAGFVSGTPVDHNALGGRSCQTCHNGVLATGVGGRHPKTTTTCADCHSSVAWSPVMHVDHADVLGSCVSCHNGKGAAGKPANHLMSGADCDRCHTASAWKPAAVDHVGILPGTCATCHNGLQAVTKSARHVLTILSCDTCHYVLGWSPVKPQPALVRRSMPRLPIVPRGRQSTTALPQ
ncbi:MAG: multiheme c-type cytochrome, partial [Proteobacteria bacterium]|nr:multiheme c-type cytochrome [Pseudomonadota bacterium]